MKKLLVALAVIGGVILITGRKSVPSEPVYTSHKDAAGDWWLLEDDKIVCGPLPLEENVADALKRYKSTGHC